MRATYLANSSPVSQGGVCISTWYFGGEDASALRIRIRILSIKIIMLIILIITFGPRGVCGFKTG